MPNILSLTERLASPATGLDTEIWVPLLRLLAQGQPVGLGTLAATAGKTMPEVIRALAEEPWLAAHPDGSVLPLDDACRVGALMAETLKHGIRAQQPTRAGDESGACASS